MVSALLLLKRVCVPVPLCFPCFNQALNGGYKKLSDCLLSQPHSWGYYCGSTHQTCALVKARRGLHHAAVAAEWRGWRSTLVTSHGNQRGCRRVWKRACVSAAVYDSKKFGRRGGEGDIWNCFGIVHTHTHSAKCTKRAQSKGRKWLYGTSVTFSSSHVEYCG